MSKAGHLSYAPVVWATLLLAAAGSAERSRDVFSSVAAHGTLAHLIVAQASHAPPGVPGSTDLGGSSTGGSHTPPPVPGSTDLGSSSSGGSHTPPPVPGAAASSGGNPPGPNPAGASHAAPQVPMMGGNP